MAQFLNDTFTDTDAVLLENHTGETGATWTKHPSFSTGSMKIVGNCAGANTGSENHYYASGAPAGPSYTVTGHFYMVTGGLSYVWTEIDGRFSTSSDNRYTLNHYDLNHNWTLDRVVVGSHTTLGTWGETIGSGETRKCQLSMNGTGPTVLKGYIEDVERISYSDSTDITAAGKAGVGTYDGYSGTYFRIQDIVADDIAAGGAIYADSWHPEIQQPIREKVEIIGY